MPRESHWILTSHCGSKLFKVLSVIILICSLVLKKIHLFQLWETDVLYPLVFNVL